MVLDVPNSFVQTNMSPNMVIMKITGVLVYMLVELYSKMYRKQVVFENGNKLIYAFVL